MVPPNNEGYMQIIKRYNVLSLLNVFENPSYKIGHLCYDRLFVVLNLEYSKVEQQHLSNLSTVKRNYVYLIACQKI